MARRAARDVVLQVIGRMLNLMLGIVVTATVIRILGQEGYGRWSMVLMIVTLVDIALSFGIDPTAVRLAAGDPARERRWVTAVVTLRAALALPAAIVTILLLIVISAGNGPMMVISVILGGGLLLAPLHSLRVIFQLQVANATTTTIAILNGVLWGVGVALIAVFGGGIVWLAIAFMAAAIATAVLQAWMGIRRMPLERPTREIVTQWREILRIGIPVSLSGLLILAYARVDQLIVFRFAGAGEAGLYGAVYRVLEQAAFIPTSVMATVAPLIAASWPNDRERMGRLVDAAGALLAISSFGALAFTIVASDQIVLLLFGAEFAAAAPALPVLLGAFVFICVGYLSSALVVVLELQRRQLALSAVGLVLNVALNLMLVPEYGFLAAAWLTMLTEALVNVPIFIWALRRAGITPHVGRFARTTVAAVLLGVGVAVLSASVTTSLLLLIPAAAVLYPALLFGLRAVDLELLRSLLGRRL
jgi:O-antigen/teichoic acid export membrane protein